MDTSFGFNTAADFLLHFGSSMVSYSSDHVLTEGYDLLGEMERVYNGSEDLSPCVTNTETAYLYDWGLASPPHAPEPSLCDSDDQPMSVRVEDVQSSIISLPDNFCIANDVTNLLDKFEASDSTSQSTGELGCGLQTARQEHGAVGSKSLPVSRSVSPVVTPPSTPPPNVLRRIRSSNKRYHSKQKSAILIPMAAPTQRGRGTAKGGGRRKAVPLIEVNLPGSSVKLQRILSRREPEAGSRDTTRPSWSFQPVQSFSTSFDANGNLLHPVAVSPTNGSCLSSASDLGMSKVTDPPIAKAIMTKTPIALELLSSPAFHPAVTKKIVSLHQSKSADCLLERSQSILPESFRNLNYSSVSLLDPSTSLANKTNGNGTCKQNGANLRSQWQCTVNGQKESTGDVYSPDVHIVSSPTITGSEMLTVDDEFIVDNTDTNSEYPEMRYEFVVRFGERIRGVLGCDSVLDHDYCKDSPRRVIVEEFELALSPTKGCVQKPLLKTVSGPVLQKTSASRTSLEQAHSMGQIAKPRDGIQFQLDSSSFEESETATLKIVDEKPATSNFTFDTLESGHFVDVETKEPIRNDKIQATAQPLVSLLESMKSNIGNLLCVEDGVIKLNPALAESLASLVPLQSKTVHLGADLQTTGDPASEYFPVSSAVTESSFKPINCQSPQQHQLPNQLKREESEPNVTPVTASKMEATGSPSQKREAKVVFVLHPDDLYQSACDELKQKVMDHVPSSPQHKSSPVDDGVGYSPLHEADFKDQVASQANEAIEMNTEGLYRCHSTAGDCFSPSVVKSPPGNSDVKFEDPDHEEFQFQNLQIGSHAGDVNEASDDYYDHDEFEETWNKHLQMQNTRIWAMRNSVTSQEKTVKTVDDKSTEPLPVSSGRGRSDAESNSGLSQRSRPYQRSRRGRWDWRPSDSPVREEVDGLGYNKIPAYVTGLAIPTNTGRRQLTADDVVGMTVHDFLPADHSPPRGTEEKMFNKMPAYASCFTNSTKYDGEVLPSSVEHHSDAETMATRSPAQCPSMTSSMTSSLKPLSRLSNHGTRGFSHTSPSCEFRTRSRRCRSVSESSDSSSGSRSSRSGCRQTSPYSYRSRSRSRSSSHGTRYCLQSQEKYKSSRSKKRRGSSEHVSEDRQKKRDQRNRDKVQKMKDRKIVYVGNIPDGFTRRQLRKRFECFGEIEEVSVHFREGDNKDNYGFVTYYRTEDAYAAIDKGNNSADDVHFDLSFGGRRQFCSDRYADLDGNMVIDEEYSAVSSRGTVDYDTLLRQAMRTQTKNR